MTRKNAREISVVLSFAAASAGCTADELLGSFFSAEHYPTLAAENELFTDAPDETQLEYIRRLCSLVSEHAEELDGYIERYSKGWKAERISRTARAVLRTAICEILYLDDVPAAVAINEAVELDKSYDDAETVAFVNGVLGGFMRGEMDVKTGPDAE